jgi:hypothetical protein
LSTQEYRKTARKLVLRRRGFQPFNGEDWGMASVELPSRAV